MCAPGCSAIRGSGKVPLKYAPGCSVIRGCGKVPLKYAPGCSVIRGSEGGVCHHPPKMVPPHSAGAVKLLPCSQVRPELCSIKYIYCVLCSI